MTPETEDDAPTAFTLTDEDQRLRDDIVGNRPGAFQLYLRTIWPMIEPRFPLIEGWYLDAMCDHAQAFGLRQIRSILVSVPPRFAKSTVWSIALPTWLWARDARRRILAASYAGGPSIDHAVRARQVVQSLWYERLFGELVRIRPDVNAKEYYELTAGGYRITTQVGGGTGKGGDLTILDDPHNIKERLSKKVLAHAIDWHDTTWFGRLDDLVHGGRAVIGQRVKSNDLIGHLLPTGEYEYLHLPQEYSRKRTVTVEGNHAQKVEKTSLGFEDPRTKDGELLCEKRMGPKQVAASRKVLKGDFQAQQNQNPTPDTGKMFKREWLRKILRARPQDVLAEVRFWDVAATTEEENPDAAQTAGCRMLRTQRGWFVIVNVTAGMWTPFGVEENIHATAVLDGRRVPVREEREGGSSGKSIVAFRAQKMAGFDYSSIRPNGDKETRAKPVRTQAEAGNLYFLVRENNAEDQAWYDATVQELIDFPNADLKDRVDAISGALEFLATETAQLDDPNFPIVY